MVRLDRTLANPEWKIKFPEAVVDNLPRTVSNHCPMVIHRKEDLDHVFRGCHVARDVWRNSISANGWLGGIIKINTDGSWDDTSKAGSFGGLVRDDQGRWLVGFFGKVQECTGALNAELDGILYGMNLAHEKGWNHAELESDSQSQTVVDLNNKEGGTSHPLANIIKDCIELKKINKVSASHILREGNSCADWLTKEGRRQEDRFVEFHEVPNQLVRVLEEDASGMTRERMS